MFNDDDAQEMFNLFRQTYHDRGFVKWNGFYLSDHTARLEKEAREDRRIWQAQPEMALNEIQTLAYYAYANQKMSRLQLNILTVEDCYLTPIIGQIVGFGPHTLYLKSTTQERIRCISFSDIRHFELL